MLADVLPCRRERRQHGVRLRREREVDGGLGEVQLRLRQADVLDGARSRHRHDEGVRIGEADVLGGEDHHAAGDEARILAGLEHRGEVVDRRIGIGAAHRLDEGGGEVVVLVAGPVVAERPLPCCVLDVRRGERLPGGRCGLRRELEDVERRAAVAARARRDQLDDLVRRLGAEQLRAAADDRRQVVLRERLELVDGAAGEQGGIDLEVRVLGRRADQRQQALLDGGQQARPAVPC